VSTALPWSAQRDALALLLGTLRISAERLPEQAPAGGSPIAAAVAACGARATRVEVAQALDWRPRSPILAVHREAGPVVLLPRAHRWCRVSPTGPGTLPVESDALEPVGWIVRPRLPHDGLTGIRLLAFAAMGTRHRVGSTVAAGLLATLLTFVTPLGSLLLIVAAETGSHGLVTPAVALLALALPLAWAAGWVRDRTSTDLQGRLQAAAEPAVWDRLLSLPMPFFREHPLRSLLGYAGGIGRLRALFGTAGLDAVGSAVFSTVAVTLLTIVDPRLGGAACALTVVMLATVGWLCWRQQEYDTRVYAGVEGVQALLYPAMLGIDEVHSYGAEGMVYARWRKAFDSQKRADGAGLRFEELSAALISAALPLFLAALLPMAHLLGTGMTGAWAVVFAAVQLNLALSRLPGVLQAVFSFRTTHERLRPILTAHPENPAQARLPGVLCGRIELRGVRFGYPSATAPVLSDVSLSVAPGQFVAVVGESGTGKSTLLRLLLGLEAPTGGAVLLDGHDLAGLDIETVRAQIGYVPQDGKALRGDIRSAILGGLPDGTDEAAWEAAEIAGLAADIRALPMGIRTRLTDGGSGLSGGQVQRLLLARALARKPRILLLDEATSALDNATQDLVSAAVAGLGLTRIVVAHRLSTIRQADSILVLSAGEIAESGTFTELIARNGLFAQLVAPSPPQVRR
jgi:ABC-type bacteriocin/lantibiotic exporter with double-glycine peptidase domain